MLSPVPIASVLVIAPDADLRQSLAFLFEANGVFVRACPGWPAEPEPRAFDAVILDEAAVPRATHGDPRLAGLRDRIILLAGRVGPTPDIPHARLVRKPLLDALLLDLVQAMAASHSPATK